MEDKVILHCDLNSFYASVELLSYPEYREVPVAVCGDPKSRHGIILAKNEAAKQFGIVTAETVWQAKRKCPHLILLPAHRDAYLHYSKLVNAIYERYTDLVEPFSIDESWLDVTGSRRLFGNGVQIANTLRKEIKETLGLTISVGVSFNKIFAKLGSDYKKPDATTVITRENYRSLLWPLPVTAMIFVGDSAAKKLRKAGVGTIGQLARFDRSSLRKMLGKMGETLCDYANGIADDTVAPVGQKREVKSIGNSNTFAENLTGIDKIKEGLLPLCESVAMRLRSHGLRAGSIAVTIRSPQFRDISRQKKVAYPICTSREIFAAAMELIHANWNPSSPIRLLAVTASALTGKDDICQLSLFDAEKQQNQKTEALEATMDSIKARFGEDSLVSARVLRPKSKNQT